MPNASRTINKSRQLSNVNCQLFKSGFSLVDVLLTMLLIGIFSSILLVGSGSYLTTRKSNYKVIASKIASEQIDAIRKQVADDPNYLTSLPNPSNSSFSHADLTKLPNGTGTQSLTNFQSATDIKLTTVTVGWNENNTSLSVNFETIIYADGLH